MVVFVNFDFTKSGKRGRKGEAAGQAKGTRMARDAYRCFPYIFIKLSIYVLLLLFIHKL